jgi:predicted MPP superfamily phosphohydrolase
VLTAALKELVKEEQGYTVLLSHRPEWFRLYCDFGLDLIFSGHAHGGQFRLPFVGGVIAPNQWFFPEYDAGVFTEGGTSMVVSRGLGGSIIPLRINNRPELVLTVLHRQER